MSLNSYPNPYEHHITFHELFLQKKEKIKDNDSRSILFSTASFRTRIVSTKLGPKFCIKFEWATRHV